MSSITKELSRASSYRYLRIDSSTSYNFANNLASYSCTLDNYANTIDSLTASNSQHDFANQNLDSSLSHQIKFNNSKLDIEMIQIENQLKKFVKFV